METDRMRQRKETERCSGKLFSPLSVDGAVVLTTINSVTTHSRCSVIMVQSHGH